MQDLKYETYLDVHESKSLTSALEIDQMYSNKSDKDNQWYHQEGGHQAEDNNLAEDRAGHLAGQAAEVSDTNDGKFLFLPSAEVSCAARNVLGLS